MVSRSIELLSRHRRASLLFALAAGTLIGDLSLFIVPLLVGELIKTFGFSEGQMGLIIAGRLALLVVTSFLVASRMHRWDGRKVAIAGAGAIVFANLISAVAASTEMYVASRFVLGAGEGAILTAVTALAAKTRDPEKTFSLIALGVVGGAIVVYLTVPYALAALGLELTFLLTALAVLFLAPALWLLGPSSNDTVVTAMTAFPWTLVGAGVLLAELLLNVGANTMWFYVELIGARLGLGVEHVGTTLALVCLFALVGPIIAHQLNTKYGRLLPISAGFVLLGFAAMLTTHAATPLFYMVGISISSAMLGFCGIYLVGLAAYLDPSGRLAGATRGFVAIGNTIAPGLGGTILLAGGTYETIGWVSLLASLGAIMVIYSTVQTTSRPIPGS